MRRLQTSALLAIGLLITALGSPGCFVFDELNAGQEVMDKHSSRPAGGAAVEKASEGGMNLASLKERSAERIGVIQEKVEEAMRPKPHPDDVIINCRIDGGTQFMRKFSCQSLGGRVLTR